VFSQSPHSERVFDITVIYPTNAAFGSRSTRSCAMRPVC